MTISLQSKQSEKAHIITNIIPIQTATLDVNGMKCAGCVKAVERQIIQQEGVVSANVNLITSIAKITYKSGKVKPEDLAHQLTSRGFPSQVRRAENSTIATIKEIAAKKKQQQQQEQIWQLISAAILLILSTIGHLHHIGLPPIPILTNIWFHWALATLALLIPGREIILDGWRGLWYFTPNMNSLVGLGSVSAYLASCIALIFPELGWECFFEEPVMLLGFIFLGRVLEGKAKGKASAALEGLLNIRPSNARLVGKINTFEDAGTQIPAEEIRVGEWVRVLAGEKIPVDGIIVNGEGSIEESMLTGESIPVAKKEGDTVIAGTMNLSGVITVETTRIGDESTLNQIIATVENAQTRKAPVQKLADTISGYFAYGVMLIASLTFCFWYFIGTKIYGNILITMDISPLLLSLKLAIAVLVVACPCALGLATPTAILVGTGIGAEKGLLIKGGDILERVKDLDTIVFDKTGTLTQGYPEITKIIPLNNASPEDILQKAASIEKNSNHPLASSIMTSSQKLEIPLLPTENLINQIGMGIGAKIHGEQIWLGNEKWLTQQGVKISPDSLLQAENLAKLGDTIVYIAENNQLIGLIALADKLRPTAQSTVTALQSLGFQVVLLSGDRATVVKAIANQLGINTYYAEVQPSQKAELIKGLKVKGASKTLAMVGDGINDAPALAEADLAISLPQGAEIAMETAGIILMSGQLKDVVKAIKLSNATLGKIKQNLFWALGYNIITIPIAVGVLLPFYGIMLNPSIAGALMALSSVIVVTNSLLLMSFKD